MHRCIFPEGCPLSLPQSRIGRGHKTPASLQKVGALSVISRLHGKSQSKGFRKPPGARVGQPQSAGDLSCGKGRPSCYSPVHFSGGLPPLFPAIPNRTGTQNSRLFCKRWEQRLFIVFPIRDRAGSGRSSSPLPLRKRGGCGILFSYNTLPKEADYGKGLSHGIAQSIPSGGS